MKKLLPIFISVFIILVNTLPSFASGNVLRGVNVRKVADSYTIEITSTAPARMTKNIVSANRVIINLKDIDVSSGLSTKFNGVSSIDNVMVEPCGNDNVNILVQGDNVAYSNVEFKEPNMLETAQSSFLGLFKGNGLSKNFQYGCLILFLFVLVSEIKFVKSKYDEFENEKQLMLKDIENTREFKDYLPGYGRAGIKKPYTTPIYTSGVNTAVRRTAVMKKFTTPETLTLNSILKNENNEPKIIDRIINNTPVFGTLSNINISEYDMPKMSSTKVSNPVEKARLKSNIKHLEELTALYRGKAAMETSEKSIRERLNQIY